MRKGRDGGKKRGKKTGEKKREKTDDYSATTSLPAVDRPNADRWNAARSRQNGKRMMTSAPCAARLVFINMQGH